MVTDSRQHYENLYGKVPKSWRIVCESKTLLNFEHIINCLKDVRKLVTLDIHLVSNKQYDHLFGDTAAIVNLTFAKRRTFERTERGWNVTIPPTHGGRELACYRLAAFMVDFPVWATNGDRIEQLEPIVNLAKSVKIPENNQVSAISYQSGWCSTGPELGDVVSIKKTLNPRDVYKIVTYFGWVYGTDEMPLYYNKLSRSAVNICEWIADDSKYTNNPRTIIQKTPMIMMDVGRASGGLTHEQTVDFCTNGTGPTIGNIKHAQNLYTRTDLELACAILNKPMSLQLRQGLESMEVCNWFIIDLNNQLLQWSL
jgi:hypothetical protein